MLSRQRRTLLVLPLLLASLSVARANLASDYIFMTGTGSQMDMSGSTLLAGSGNDDYWSPAQQMGFTFNLDGQAFTYFIASTNGPVMLGTTSSLSFSYIYAYNSFNQGNCPQPMIAAFFDDMVASGNGMRTKLFGAAPNRIRVVEWEGYLWYGSGTDTEYLMQVRMYEGSNKIELWYGQMGSSDVTNGNGQIGASMSTSNYIAIALGTPPTAGNSITVNDLSRTPIAANTLFTLRPCQKNFTIAGNPGQGGTATMDSGAVLLANDRARVGSSIQRQPFTISMGEFPCGTSTYTYTLTGTNAADYSITPGSGNLGSFGTNTPTLSFAPSDTGLRVATLRITDGKGFDRSYSLRGVGFRCVEWVGDPSQGGTLRLENGDTLLGAFQVPIGSARDYTPIRIDQLSEIGGCTDPVQVTYTLDDPSGNYAISPMSEMVPVGGSSIPTVTFNAMNGVGFQEATLTVIADGERRSFLLRNFISAPGGEIRHGGTAIGPGLPLFRDQATCIGEMVISLELQATNIGTGDFIVRDIEGFMLDTTLRQGVPPYPLLIDAFGQPVPAQDYFLSKTPGTAPRLPGQRFDSLVVPEGQTTTFYLNIVPTRAGKRYSRLWFSTNAFNLTGPDVNGDTIRGMTSVDVFARGMGSLLAGGPDAGRPKPAVFPATKVRESRTMTASVYNDGDCDLRVDQKRLRFEAGDVSEFELLSVNGGSLVGETYILAPGQRLDITVRFTPNRSGSRRATMRLVTNDSSLIIPEITERGIFYLEFFGVGKHDLEARDLHLSPAVIKAETSSGVVLVENTKVDPVIIDSIRIVGGNGEIIMNPDRPWPSMPLKIGPGELLELGITLLPDPNGSEGTRQAEILIFLSNGDTTRAMITGYAGTRELTASPSALFQNSRIAVGDIARAYLTVSNNGTLPAVMTQVVITGPDAAFYTITPLERRVVQPGQSEYFEVTYLPGSQGMHSASIEVHSNATNGTQIVQLGGEGLSIVPGGGIAFSTGTVSEGTPLGRDDAAVAGMSGYGLRLIGISPNPTPGQVKIGYSIPNSGMHVIELYALDGTHVRTLFSGTGDAGAHELQADLRELPQAAYVVLLRSGGRTTTARVSLAR